MDPEEILSKYYEGTEAYHYVLTHGRKVAEKALEVAERVKDLNPDKNFIYEAALLHDIGAIRTDAEQIGCHGEEPYIKHGILGREILEKEGLPEHALVCERHLGIGLTKEDIREQQLPLPERDMKPETIEEEIITFADKFYSKKLYLNEEKPIKLIRESLRRKGEHKVRRFDEWMMKFREPNP
ncbi:MAG: HD domain-containing protein [Nanobdellota archaeon]